MVERLLDMAQNLPLGANTLSDKDKECVERFYGYICAGADKSRALGYYAYHADSGDFVVHYIAGLCYYLALDFVNARKCFESICANSDSQSTFRHIDSSEIQINAKDLQKIKARCYRHIGAMYNNGRGVEQNYNKAVELYQKAADLGDADAFFNLGLMYYNGQGVAQDYNKAVELYQKACDLGNAGAFNNLGGGMYYSGRGVNQDKQKALQLFKKACDMGNEKGCKNYRILRDELNGGW